MSIQETAYAKYQLDWMVQNNISLSDLMNELKNYQYQDPEDSNMISTPVTEIFEDWQADVGFGGSLWVCFNEFLEYEYCDNGYMRSLLSDEEYTEYISSEKMPDLRQQLDVGKEGIPVNRVTLIRNRDSEQEQWPDVFWVDTKHTPTYDLFKAVVQSYLKTPAGFTDIESTSDDFNWGDAIMCVPSEAWSKYGIYPNDSQKSPAEMGLSPTSSMYDSVISVDQDELLIPDIYYAWQEQGKPAIDDFLKPILQPHIQIFHHKESELSAFHNVIKYWCNALGELHHHGEYDITEDELPSELHRAYNDLWPLGHGTGSYCYLVETSKGFGVALVNEYDESFADDCSITMDELFKSALKDSEVISATSEFSAADIYVAEQGGFNEAHELIVVFPWDYPADKFKAAASLLHDLAYQSAKEMCKKPALGQQIQSAESRAAAQKPSQDYPAKAPEH